MRRAAWVEVDLGAIVGNASTVAEIAGTELLAVVKADAYGHGAVSVARALERVTAVCGFGVATPDEALELREAGIRKPILLLGSPLTCERELAAAGVQVSIGSRDELRRVADAVPAEQHLELHIELETGMGRTGARPEQLPAMVAELSGLGRLRLRGIYSHFPVAETDVAFSREQLAVLTAAAQPFRRDSVRLHIANSAGLVRLPEARLDLCRPGAMLYGFNPGMPEEEMPPLCPALSLKARVAVVRELRPGETIGYGRAFCAGRPMMAAVLPLGYADGYPRRLSDNADVLIRGRRHPVVGQLSMDSIVVDVTDAMPVEVGDEAVLLGAQGDERITVAQLAQRAGTIPHEITTCLRRRLPRLYREPPP